MRWQSDRSINRFLKRPATTIINLQLLRALALIASICLPLIHGAFAQDGEWLKYNREGMQAMARGAIEQAERSLLLAIERAEFLGDADSRPDGNSDPDFVPNAGMELSASLNNLGLLYQQSGRYALAEDILLRAISIRREVYGDRHRYYAQSLTSLARTLQDQDKFDEAEPLFNDALAIYFELFGPSHPLVADALNNLGSLHHGTRRYDSAQSFLQRALDIQKKLFGARHPRVTTTLSNLASLAIARGEQDTAMSLYRDVIAIRRMTRPVDFNGLVIALNNLGTVLYRGCQNREAEQLLSEADAIIVDRFNRSHPQAGLIQYRLAQIAASTDRHREADELFSSALELEQSMVGDSHPRLAPILMDHADLLERIERLPLAREMRERARKIRELNQLPVPAATEYPCLPTTV